jgi:hypothetical protein
MAGQQAPASAPAAAALLSLEQHACLRAELELQPERAGQIYQAYALDEPRYRAQVEQLRQRFATDPSLEPRFQQLCQYYRAIMAPRS